jgi:hypothetical protein
VSRVPRRRPRHPARRTRRAVGAASVAGFAAIGGAVALDANATASPTTVPTTVDTNVDDGTVPQQQQPWQPEGRTGTERRNDQFGGPIAGSSGAPSPDTSSHGS